MTQVTTSVRLKLQVSDGGSVQKVKTLDSALDDLDRSIDLLSRDLGDSGADRFGRDLDEAAKAADRLDRQTRAAGRGADMFGKQIDAATVALGAFAAAVLLARQQEVEFQQSVAFTADATGASGREIEALGRVAAEYGIDIGRVSDAYRDFTERLGEARLEPTGSIAEAFRVVGFNINDADANLLSFLTRVSELENRALEAFVIRTVLTGDSEEFLQLVRDGATSRVQVEFAFSDADRDAFLESNRALIRAGQSLLRILNSLSVLVAEPLAVVASLLERDVQAVVNVAKALAALPGWIATELQAFIERGVGRPRFFQEQASPTLAQDFQPPGSPVPTAQPPLSDALRDLQESGAERFADAIASANRELELLDAQDPLERQRLQIEQNADLQRVRLQEQKAALEAQGLLSESLLAQFNLAIELNRQLEARLLLAITPADHDTSGRPAALVAFQEETDQYAAAADRYAEHLGELDKELGSIDEQLEGLVPDFRSLAFRGQQGARLIGDSLTLLGVDAPRHMLAFRSGVDGLFDVLDGFQASDPLSVLSGGVSLLASAVTLLRSRSEEATLAQEAYARAMAEVARQSDQIANAVLGNTGELNELQRLSTAAFRSLIDAPNLQPDALRDRITEVVSAFAEANLETVGDLSRAQSTTILALSDELGDLFRALGIRLEDAPDTRNTDPSELRNAQARFLQPFTAFTDALTEAFGESATLADVIQTALTLDDALADLTSTINALTAAEESQLRERFNLERIQLRSRAQREFAQAGQDPFEQERIFQRLEGELAAITAAENAALESARQIATGGDLGTLVRGAPNLPPTQEQTEEAQRYLVRLEELTAQVLQLDLTSADGLRQFNVLAAEFRTLFFEAIGGFDSLPPALDHALTAAQTIFQVAGHQAGQVFRQGLEDRIANTPPEQLDPDQLIQIRPSLLGDGRWDVIFTPGEDGIQLPPILGIGSERLLELFNSQELADWSQVYVGGPGEQVLPETLLENSDRVFRINGLQALDLWQRLYDTQSAGAGATDVLPDPLVDNSARVFHIGSRQTLVWRSIFFPAYGAERTLGTTADILPPPIVMPSERVARIGSRKILTTNDLFDFRIVPRIIEASSLVRVVGSVSVQVPDVEVSGPGRENPSVTLENREPRESGVYRRT